jgi:hypothetical protein
MSITPGRLSMTVIPVAPSQPSVIRVSMLGEDSSGTSSESLLATGTGHAGGSAPIWTGAAEREHAPGRNQRTGEGGSGFGCRDNLNAARRVCHAGWQFRNTRWVVQLGWSTYRSNLGTPSRSAHGPNHSACRYL